MSGTWMTFCSSTRTRSICNTVRKKLKLTSASSAGAEREDQHFPPSAWVDFLGFHTYITESGQIVRKLRRSSLKAMSGRSGSGRRTIRPARSRRSRFSIAGPRGTHTRPTGTPTHSGGKSPPKYLRSSAYPSVPRSDPAVEEAEGDAGVQKEAEGLSERRPPGGSRHHGADVPW